MCVCVFAYLSNSGPPHWYSLTNSKPVMLKGTFQKSTVRHALNYAIIVYKGPDRDILILEGPAGV